MKKLTIFLLIILTVLTFSQISFAASYHKSGGTAYTVIEGTVASIDKNKNLLVVKDKEDGTMYGLSAFASDLASLNQGDSVKVTVPRPGNLVSKITK